MDASVATDLAGMLHRLIPPGQMALGMHMDSTQSVATKYDAANQALTVTGTITITVKPSSARK